MNIFLQPAIKLLTELLENAQVSAIGHNGNRYSKRIRRICGYIYARGGRSLYEFFNKNLNLPCLKTVKRFMQLDLPPLSEGFLDFDALQKYIEKFNYSKSIGIFEDGAAITQNVSYDPLTNELIGLTAPFSESGIPCRRFHHAEFSFAIVNAIREYSKCNTVQVIITRPNTSNAVPFILGYYFSDNKFTFQDICNRYLYIKKEFDARGWKFFTFNMDGDPKGLKAQKMLTKFGHVTNSFGIDLAAAIDQETSCSQDYLHKLKKKKSALFSKILRVGNSIALIGHLEMIVEKFGKHEHGLVKSDLNVLDRLDYR